MAADGLRIDLGLVTEPAGPESPPESRRPRSRTVPLSAYLASVLVAVIVGGAVAAGVTLGILRLQGKSLQRVDLAGGVTVSESSAAISVAQSAQPAVVSILTGKSNQPMGSGFLVSGDGYVVTNVGVVANAQQLTVVLPDGYARHDAQLVDYDCGTGVAVLKIDGVSGLPTLGLGDSNGLSVGQDLVVVGGPLTTEGSVSTAMVSALHRTMVVNAGLGDSQLGDLILLDSPIAAGNQGGPLLDLTGQVVGVTMEGISGGRSVDFALAASDLAQVVQQIEQNGTLVVASLGAQTQEVSSADAALNGGVPGARIVAVAPEGPLAQAGLKPGDVITQIDDVRLDDAHPLAEVLRSQFSPDQRVTVTYWRGGTTSQVELTLAGEHPSCP
jgi:putative serine protease PepD